ncbi:MAG TPA: alpha/beta hydrolase [Cryomorphaceae bacterium]|nr:alpha/beta hydrolase [Cryomorphaceae bacterium]
MKAIVTLIFSIMITTGNSQSWLNTGLYPFDHHYLQLDEGTMHYIDEGEGEIILFVHGTPTWSFLYREFIKDLSGSFRCIAPDHLGFGLSDKPSDFTGTPQAHARNLSTFIQKLNLHNITLVVHDFGGPIGIGAALQNQGRIQRIVLFNTWLWESKSRKEVQKIDKLVHTWLGKFLYLNMNISPKALLKKGFSDPSYLTKTIHQHYINPFPDKASRHSLLKLAQSLAGSSDWYQQQWENLHKLENKEWLVLWGTKDEFITSSFLDTWKERLPKATVKEWDCGHFVQEERAKESILAIRNLMAG